MKLTEEQKDRLRKSANGRECPFCHAPLIAPADRSFQLVSFDGSGKVDAAANVGLLTCANCGFVSMINLDSPRISDWERLKEVRLP